MAKVRRDQLRRLEHLKKLYAPGPPWRIVARFKNGTTKTLSAAEYRKAKLRDPDGVAVESRKMTVNLDELGEWLGMVKNLAEISDEDGELIL